MSKISLDLFMPTVNRGLSSVRIALSVFQVSREGIKSTNAIKSTTKRFSIFEFVTLMSVPFA